jgi:hypothetical protein
MSVDFFDCPICDCGSYFHCYKCGNSICDNCAEKYKCGNYSDTEEFPVEDENGKEIAYDDDYRNCLFCSLREIRTEDLLEFILHTTGISREELENRYRQSHGVI